MPTYAFYTNTKESFLTIKHRKGFNKWWNNTAFPTSLAVTPLHIIPVLISSVRETLYEFIEAINVAELIKQITDPN